MDLTTSIRQVGDVSVVDLSGRIVLREESAKLRSVIGDLLSQGHTKILLNLADVSYIDSSGLSNLVSRLHYREEECGRTEAAPLTAKVQDVMQITRVVHHFRRKKTKPRPLSRSANPLWPPPKAKYPGYKSSRHCSFTKVMCYISGQPHTDEKGDHGHTRSGLTTNCDYCGTGILFGGKREGNLRFCNTRCQQGGAFLALSRRVSDTQVQEMLWKVHQGMCPKCGGSGPVDVHTSYRVWSALVHMTKLE
jgi:anti-anti-sigma factor